MRQGYAAFSSLPSHNQTSETVATTPPRVWRFVEVDSTFDTAFRLATQGRLAAWESVLVATQRQGRGQMRRAWSSPTGNIYASLRLPQVPLFQGTESALVAATLFALALEQQGWPVAIKWPNDLILFVAGKPHKVAGLLLEERGDVLMAGIGINVHVAPPMRELRQDAALPAACLAQCGKKNMPTAESLWYHLVNDVISAYSTLSSFADAWFSEAERRLLWRGESVVLDDGQQHKGQLLGLGRDGSLLLQTESGRHCWQSGSLRKETIL